ncbi:MAG: hypothetical protein GXY38_09765 [Planctomycetes bacterium]|nr:hypothetical protein [Planctomycetota bacterium]
MSIESITLVHHTHTDIGYTNNFPAIAATHVRHLRDVLRRCRQDRRFRWTIEAGWALKQFLLAAGDDEKQDLLARIRSGQIEVSALYVQPLTQVCNLEELCACVEWNQELCRGLDAPITTAIIDDMGGLSYNMPQVLARHGVRYIVNGCGGWRVMLPFTTLPHVFRLASPDDSSVIFYHLGDDKENRSDDIGPAQYGFGEIYFLWPLLKEMKPGISLPGDDGEKTIFQMKGRQGVDALLARLHRDNYPLKSLLLQVSADNWGPMDYLPEAVDYWNSHYGNPTIRFGTCGEFFADVEKQYGPAIPTIKGELTCSWTEHVLTNAAATGVYRGVKRSLADVCALDACRARPSISNAEWSRVMEQLLLYCDHTCGISMWDWEKKVASYGSFWDETFDTVRRAWQINADYAHGARRGVEAMKSRQAIELCSDDPDLPKTVTVFNPLSFGRDGMLSIVTSQSNLKLKMGEGFVSADSRPINPALFLHKIWCKDMAPYGTKVLAALAEAPAPGPAVYASEGWKLAGPDLAVEIDPASGGVRSMRTASDGTEWVDASRNTLNQALYFNVDGVHQTAVRNGLDESLQLQPATVKSVRLLGGRGGLHHASAIVEVVLLARREITLETQYILDASGLSIRNRIRKVHTLDKEACYFAFPMRMDGEFHFDVEQQGQTTRFPDERLPGSTNHNLAVQDFVSVSDSQRHAVLTTRQACAMCLGKQVHYHFGLDYPAIERPTVLFYAFNNLWNTNCPLHQTDELVFEYHVGLHNEAFSASKAYRTARSATHPLEIIPGDLTAQGFSKNGCNLLECSADNVLVESLRPMDGGVWRVRLVEVDRRATRATLKFAGRLKGCSTRAESDNDEWRPASADGIVLDLGPAEMKTILLRTN